MGFSLVAASRDYSVAVIHGLLIVVASLVGENGLQGGPASVAAAPGLLSTDSTAVAHQLSCPTACGILPDQGSNQCLLHWQADSQLLSPQGSPRELFSAKKASLNCINWAPTKSGPVHPSKDGRTHPKHVLSCFIPASPLQGQVKKPYQSLVLIKPQAFHHPKSVSCAPGA